MIDLLAKLNGVRKSGEGHVACCPAHDDRRQSLHVSSGDDGRLLVKCHAGCTVDAICAAAGITTRELFADKPHTSTKGRIVAEYDYEDEGRNLLFQNVRYEPKDFRARRPNGQGGWIWNVKGVRLVLFRLPDLRTIKDKHVAIAAGEKDANRLMQVGITATTNPFGEGKWRPEYTQQLVDAGCGSVTVLPDNDAVGGKHAAQVAESCRAAGLTVKVLALPNLPAKGDVSDWFDAEQGRGREELEALIRSTPDYVPTTATAALESPTASDRGRTLTLTAASAIHVRPVRWAWAGRLALGTLGLIGGREGIGKSIVLYTIFAKLTRGVLPGAFEGTPRNVIVAATEDSWSHTIVPRLMAAGADLDRVFRVDVVENTVETGLSLPRDLADLEQAIRQVDAVAFGLDPLMSRLDGNLDSHKDSEVRLALEPLVAMADRTGTTFVGLIHVNKSASNDALTTLMGSRAFAAVARTVLFVMTDPDDEDARLLGQAKNNLGRADLPTLGFKIAGAMVAQTAEGPVWTGKLEWTGETDRSIREALETAAAASGDRSATSEAGDWLSDYLTSVGGSADAAVIRQQGLKAGHSKDSLYRARTRLGLVSTTSGFPRKAIWAHTSQSSQALGETSSTTTTANTANTDAQCSQYSHSSQSFETPRGFANTEPEAYERL